MAAFGDDYKNFNVQDFLARSFSKGTPKERFLNLMYNELEKKDKTGSKLLELGTGPSLYTSLMASKHFSEIILSEYAQLNRVELFKWLKKDEGAFDWSHYIELISQLEQSNVETIERRTRTAITDILYCDMNDDKPVPPYNEQYFDCIISTLTLECSFQDLQSYEQGLQKLADLTVPGGKLILLAAFNMMYYTVGGQKYHVLKLSQKDVENSLTKAGFGEVEIVPIEVPDFKIVSNSQTYAYVKAKKIVKM